jgi:hypothetical protein
MSQAYDSALNGRIGSERRSIFLKAEIFSVTFLSWISHSNMDQ